MSDSELKGKTLLVVLGQAVLRTVLGLVLIFVVMSLAPEEQGPMLAVPILGFGALVAIYSAFFVRQIKRVKHSRYPGVTAAEAMILAGAMFLAVFASLYTVISGNDSGAFTEPLDHFSALYFALTVLATVGFGDITPVSTSARLVTMFQMALGLAFVAVLVRVVSGAAQSATQRRKQGSTD